VSTTQTNPTDGLIRWMSGLADPSRLRLLRLLERHELGVCDLCDTVQMPQSTVSRHLKILADEGWLSSRRQGTTNLYQMLLDELEPAQRDLWRLARDRTEDWATQRQDQVRLMRLLTQRRGDAQDFFAGAAGQWDKTRAESYGGSFEPAALLGLIPPTWTVADLGCGTGSLSARLAMQVDRVLAVDNSKAMLDAAQQRLAGYGNVELLEGHLEALPIDSAAVDAAVAVLVLTYLPDPVAALHEAVRVLRPGGLLVIVDLMRHDREAFRREMGQQSMGFVESELAALLADAGLTRATCQPLPPDPKAKGPALLLARAVKPA